MSKSSPTPANLLAQIAQIEGMEFGKLSEYRPSGRSKDSGPYFKLQIWRHGKNLTRHVRPEELPALRQALDGHARFCALCDQYAESVVTQTRVRLEEGVKKKLQPYSRHSKKRSTDSSSPS